MKNPADRAIRFEVPYAFLPLNVLRHMHFSEYRRYRRMLSELVAEATRGMVPPVPHPYARLLITRHSTQLPDIDGLYGGAKPLIDCLVAMRLPSHPSGLGFVEDDNPLAMEIVVEPCLCASAGRRTVVEVTPMDAQGEEAMARLARLNASPEVVARMRLARDRPKKARAATKAVAPQGQARMTAAEYQASLAKPNKGPGRRWAR